MSGIRSLGRFAEPAQLPAPWGTTEYLLSHHGASQVLAAWETADAFLALIDGVSRPVPGLLGLGDADGVARLLSSREVAEAISNPGADDGELGGPVAKNLSEEERAGLVEAVGAKPGDAVFFAAGATSQARALLGAARNEIARRDGLIDEDAWSFVWVVDAPLFEPAGDTDDVAVGKGAWTAVHHAFTSPTPEWIDRFEESPGEALAYAYDIVCNGNEIGGGSIRIHRRDVQERVFGVMGIGPEEAQERFGFLLDAFQYGAPPHGGIAFGWDRVVALLAGADSIRETIAFPKTGGGYDPLTGAPAPISAQQRKEAGVDAKPAREGAPAAEAGTSDA